MIRDERGVIVSVSTLESLDGWGLTFYHSAISVVAGLTRKLAVEFGPKGIRANAVCTSVTAAELSTLNFQEVPQPLRGRLERIPMSRGAQPEEIASAVAFLASGDASFVTGTSLAVDGGLSALFEFSLFPK